MHTAAELEQEGKDIADRIMAGDLDAIQETTLYEQAVLLCRTYNGPIVRVHQLEAKERQSFYAVALTCEEAAEVLNLLLGA